MKFCGLLYYSTSSVSTVTPTDLSLCAVFLALTQLRHRYTIQLVTAQSDNIMLTRACPMAIYRSGQAFFIISHNKAQLPAAPGQQNTQTVEKKKILQPMLCPYSTHTPSQPQNSPSVKGFIAIWGISPSVLKPSRKLLEWCPASNQHITFYSSKVGENSLALEVRLVRLALTKKLRILNVLELCHWVT